MSAPKPTEYTPAKWRPDRLRLACRVRGIETPAALFREVTQRRLSDGRTLPDRSAVWRFWVGDADPSRGRSGHDSPVFELAGVLQVSVDWLMGRTRVHNFTRAERRRFAGDEGWS